MIKLLKEEESRRELIDYIDDIYNTRDGYKDLESALIKLFDSDLDDTGSEGIYTNLSDSDLLKLKKYLDNPKSDGEMDNLKNYQFSSYEIAVIKDAMENYAVPSFTKDPEMSRIARKILSKL